MLNLALQRSHPKTTALSQRHKHHSHLVLPSRTSARTRVLTNALSRGGSSLLSLPLFPLSSPIYPTCTGTVRVFEPRFMQMIRDIEKSTPADNTLRFGHILSPRAAPPAMLEDAVSGLPRLGVAVNIRSIYEQPDGSLLVNYDAYRRFWLLSMWQEQPYHLGCVSWYDDEQPASASDQELTDQYESELFKCLQQVSNIQRKLASSSLAGGLPEPVRRYSPPPLQPQQQPQQQHLVFDLARPHSHDVAMWRMHGSVYDTAKNSSKPSTPSDPYQAVTEEVGKAQRQELFSFAAACCVDLGPAETIGLLQSRDTAARLCWTLEAVRPYLAQLQAQLAMEQAVGS